ncbi:MAG: Gfo/Idh/MocA family oxidoreductase [Armatimonadetes bacterium]|nr:Gfo/Idh/MocA family oxidoreductase [Armatimonadota bacterium]
MRTWRIGLVGVGRGSGYGSVFARDPRCTVTACCDADEQALARFQSELGLADGDCFTSYDDFIGADVDIVFIGTPIPYHAEQTIKAVESGKHVLCEVTAASTIEDCARIVAAVRRSGMAYMLAENCCYWPFVRQWREMVQAGRLGEIIYAECEYVHDIRPLIVDPVTGTKRWRAHRAPLHYCSHSLGPILDITADRIVRACGVGTSSKLLGIPEAGGIDFQVALFETEKGAVIKLLRSSCVPRHPALHFYSLQGTGGFVESSKRGVPGEGLLYVEKEMETAQSLPVDIVDQSLPAHAGEGGHGTAEYALVRAFLSALESGQKPPLDEVRAMDLTVPGLVAHQSAMEHGRWLDVPYLG